MRIIFCLAALSMVVASESASAQLPLTASPGFSRVTTPGVPLSPGQLSTSSIGAFAQQQGIDVRYPGGLPLHRRPIPIAYPIYGWGGAYGWYPPQPVQIQIVVPPVEPAPVEPPRLGPGRRPLVGPTNPPTALRDRAQLRFKVPEGANIWVNDNQLDDDQPSNRLFTSPPIPPGESRRTKVRISWPNGEREYDLDLHAGDTKSIHVFGN